MDAADEESFREFVANRSSALLRTAVLLNGGDRHAAEDLLQNALIKAANRWHRIDEPEAYVRQVLYRQQISRWRLKGWRKELTVADVPDGDAGADGAGQTELRLVLREAMARLTVRQRTVLVLRYFEDLPEAEVARVLGCSVGTVRSTTYRSLARLRAVAPGLALDEEAGAGRPGTGPSAAGPPKVEPPQAEPPKADPATTHPPTTGRAAAVPPAPLPRSPRPPGRSVQPTEPLEIGS